MATIESQVRQIVSAIRIRSDETFEVAGETHATDPLRPATKQAREYLESPLTHDLAGTIYRQFYARRWNGTLFSDNANESEKLVREDASKRFVADLAAANHVPTGWDTHWRVAAATRTGGVVAEKDLRIRHFRPGQFIQQDKTDGIALESWVDAPVQQDVTSLQAGMWFAFSPEQAPQCLNRSSIRFYWNCPPSGVIRLVDQISSVFPRYAIPYEMKCLAHPHGYWRRDSFVLYLNPAYLSAAFYHLREIHRRTVPELEDDSPLFTRPLGRGLSVAETPTNGSSFGQHRCRLVASALVKAFTNGVTVDDERMERVANEFAAAETSLARPWLARAQSDPFGINELSL